MKTKQFCSALAAILLGGIVLNPLAHAQFTTDYQTNIISGVASNWSGDYIVGSSNTYADVLLIQSGGALSNGSGYVGDFPEGGSSNVVVVSGAGSVWNNSGGLTIGSEGREDANQLIVTNGGAVYCLGGEVGVPDGTYSRVLVTGSGSVWSDAGNLFVGDADDGSDSLIISEGGVVYDYTGYLGVATGGNLILVTGSGSVWSNQNGVILGSAGGDSLIISNGGAVYDDSAELGGDERESVLVTGTGSVWNTSGQIRIEAYEDSLTISDGGVVYSGSADLGFGGSGAHALVTGAGSVWSIGNNLEIMGGNSSASLTIADGGAVLAPSVSTSHMITISGGGLYVTNGLGTGALAVNEGALTLDGGTVTADQLSVTSDTVNSTFLAFTSGLLTSGGTVVSNGQNFAVGDGTNRARFRLASGGLGIHSFENGLTISSNAFLAGCGTIDGSVVVEYGGKVRANCGGALDFTGSVTNNGIIHVRDGTTLNFYGPVVNNGVIEARKGHLLFWSGLQNNGKIVTRRRAGPADHHHHHERR
jgi:T5SS/PEP-CTERM-associated repeat protein